MTTGRTVHQAEFDRVLREHARRLRALEANRPAGSGGSYVFLDEALAAADGDPIAFAAIDQTYRHLVIELVGGTDQTLPGAPDDIRIGWGNAAAGDFYTEDYMWAEAWFWGNTDPPTFHTEGRTYEDQFIPIYTILPAAGLNGGGPPPDSIATVTMKFAYYAAADVVRSVQWQAQGAVQSTALSTNPSAVRNAFSVGGGTQNLDAEPIDRIRLVPSVHGWRAGSRASLYGIL